MRLLGNKLAILFLLFTMCGKPPLQLLWCIGIRESKHAKSVYMGDTLDLLKQVCRRWIWLPVLLIFCCSGAALRAQDNASAGFTADEVIQILQENPDLLGEAKTQIAAALQERGYPATERDISDDRLFSTIQSDDRVRKLLSDELLKRGFVPASAEQSPAQAAATTPSAVSPQKQPTSNTTAGAGDQPASMASGRKRASLVRRAGAPCKVSTHTEIFRHCTTSTRNHPQMITRWKDLARRSSATVLPPRTKSLSMCRLDPIMCLARAMI